MTESNNLAWGGALGESSKHIKFLESVLNLPVVESLWWADAQRIALIKQINTIYITNQLKFLLIVRLLLSNRETWELGSRANTFADENSPRHQLWETFCCYLIQCYNCHLRKVSLSPWSTHSVTVFELMKVLEELMKTLRERVSNGMDGALYCRPPWPPAWS